jgi:hypothetical protein
MKKFWIPICMVALALFAFGCSQEPALAPQEDAAADDTSLEVLKGRHNAPPQYYSFYWTAVGMSAEVIDVRHGEGIPYLDDIFLDEFPGRGLSAGLGLTFDVDGTCYILNNWLGGDNPNLCELTRVDMTTGETTVIAEIQNHFSGSEIDACGNLYTVGFEPQGINYGYYLSPLYQDKLCMVNKYTGEVTPIGEGTGLPDVMDLAFDSAGNLWATTDNKMYIIDLETGVANWVSDITNVPSANPDEPNPMMIMSIAFDKHDNLFGTGIIGFCSICEDPSPIMQIDPYSGEGTLLGFNELGYNHGGDTMPTKVRIAHRNGDGSYQCKTISLDALEAHLAHGDFVPGTDGHDCECPDGEPRRVRID